MIVHTRRGLNAMLARYRRAVAVQLAEAIEATLPDPCDHRNRPSCARCAEYRTTLAAAKTVRQAGGVL